MNQLRYNWRTVVNLAPILGLAFALASQAQSMPEGPGRAVFQRTCSACHSLTVVTSQRLSSSGWENVVDNMVSRGASGTPDELKEIVRYLTANYGVGPSQGSPRKLLTGRNTGSSADTTSTGFGSFSDSASQRAY